MYLSKVLGCWLSDVEIYERSKSQHVYKNSMFSYMDSASLSFDLILACGDTYLWMLTIASMSSFASFCAVSISSLPSGDWFQPVVLILSWSLLHSIHCLRFLRSNNVKSHCATLYWDKSKTHTLLKALQF